MPIIQNEVDVRMLKVVDALRAKGTLKSKANFYNELEMKKQNFYKIEKGQNHFTTAHILEAIRIFRINPAYLFGVSETMFLGVNNAVNNE